MTLGTSHHRWHSEFTDDELIVVRSAIPAAVKAGQDRSARAHIEYGDPDGDQYVYGAGMSRGVQKELMKLLSELPSFRVETVKGTTRKLIFVHDKLLFPIRVGKRMPRNHRRVRIPYMPDTHRDVFALTGITKYGEPGLFDLPQGGGDESARFNDVLGYLEGALGRESLIVPYYSSSPTGVGSVFWAPARLSGKNYLHFSDPERLVYLATAADVAPTRQQQSERRMFADGERPRTMAKLRMKPSTPEPK